MTLRPSRRAVLSAAAVLLTGCSEVPSQGPVKRADGPRAAARESIDVAPHPPADGASIDLVVGGFLQAMASVRDDYRVARSYLTSDIADRWDPHAKVTIYDATNHKPASTVATAALQAPVVGQIDSRGHYHPTSSQTLNHDFGMAQESGQWRISRPPEGVLISQYTFQRSWSTIPIYFLTEAADRLVPDVIHLPSAAADPDAALRAMTAGVPEPLDAVLRTALPDGVTVTGTTSVDAVGVVTVPLSASAAQLSPSQRRLLASQVTWTLNGFAAISRIRFTAGGSLLSLPEAAEDQSVSADLYAEFIPFSRYPLTDRGRRHQGADGACRGLRTQLPDHARSTGARGDHEQQCGGGRIYSVYDANDLPAQPRCDLACGLSRSTFIAHLAGR